jgi:hypothetical protein
MNQWEIFGLSPTGEPVDYDQLEADRQRRYGYNDHTWAEIHRMARLALPHGSTLKRATLREDFGGVDAHYMVNQCCPMQVRARFNRPIGAADIDVSWRETEPAMIAANTYAPLALFVWFMDDYAEAGKLIDVYRMAAEADPPLDRRPVRRTRNGNFLTVTIAELHDIGALLMLGGRDRWAPARLGGERDTTRILAKARAA